jgi:hypothetical protein
MEDLKSTARYRLNELLGDDAFYDHLEDVVRAYRKQFNLPLPSAGSGTDPQTLNRGA